MADVYAELSRNDMARLLDASTVASISFSLTDDDATNLVYTTASALPDAGTMTGRRFKSFIQGVEAGTITIGSVNVADPDVPGQQQHVDSGGAAAVLDAAVLAALAGIALDTTLGQVADNTAAAASTLESVATESTAGTIATSTGLVADRIGDPDDPAENTLIDRANRLYQAIGDPSDPDIGTLLQKLDTAITDLDELVVSTGGGITTGLVLLNDGGVTAAVPSEPQIKPPGAGGVLVKLKIYDADVAEDQLTLYLETWDALTESWYVLNTAGPFALTNGAVFATLSGQPGGTWRVRPLHSAEGMGHSISYVVTADYVSAATLNPAPIQPRQSHSGGTATGGTRIAIWTPATGARILLKQVTVQISANASLDTGGILTIALLDNVQDYNAQTQAEIDDPTDSVGLAYRVFVPGSAGAALGALTLGPFDFGDGLLSRQHDWPLMVLLSDTLTTGIVNVVAVGTEITDPVD